MTDERTDPTHTDSDDRAEAEREVERARDEHGRDPHHDLSNPATDPDPTEYPDPYERRPDPRDRDKAPTDPSTSEPHPPRNREQTLREGFEPEE